MQDVLFSCSGLKARASFFAAVLTVVGGFNANSANGDAYDPPANYYSTAAGLTGPALKNQLYLLTSGQVAGAGSFTYHNYGDSRYTLNQLWQDPNNTANVLTIYSSTSLSGTWTGLNSPPTTNWNREHIDTENSLGISVTNTYSGYGSDEFELAPATVSDNSSRSNDGYGFTGSTGTPSKGTYGSEAGTGGTYWYAGTQFRGDVARSLFYEATRYGQNQGASSTLSIDKSNLYNVTLVNGVPNTSGQMGDLNSLLHWAYEDPVDTFERRKNQLVYTGMTASQISGSASQGNRNPYIDHPEYIWAVFGTGPNTSQLSVGNVSNVAANGASSTSVNLGRVIAGTSFGTSNVTLNKTGLTPTTFNVTTAGSATSTLAGAGETFNYSSSITSVDTKTMAVGLASPATAGAVAGTIAIHNSDLTSAGIGDGSADGDDTVNVSGTAVDHSNASFSSTADIDQLTLSFGSIAQNSGSHTLGFSIADLLSASGYTAGLDLDNISGTGNTSILSTNLTTFSDETAGTADSFAANIDTSNIGTYSAEYTLSVSDENIPGATAGTSLVLDITGSVTAVPEPGSLMVISVISIGLLGRSRRR